MPHLRLEYTANIAQKVDFQALFADLQGALSRVGGIPMANFKSRAYRLDAYRIAEGSPDQAFVHLDIRMFEGRPDDLKQAMLAAVMDVLKSHYAATGAGPEIQFSVEIQDIRRAAYLKSP